MKTRVESVFERCRRDGRAALIVYVCCGFPDLAASEEVIQGAIDSGADIIELGVPFSDPMADGPVIQEASQIALKNGTTLKKVLAMAERIRRRNPQTGLMLFSYFNVLYNYGLEPLTRELARIGVDGILSVDLPFEERSELEPYCRAQGLHLIPLVSPATSEARIAQICAGASGFVYYVSVRGITGVRASLPEGLSERLERVRAISPVPVAVGFGIGDPGTARALARHADGIVVGSAALRPLLEEGELRGRLETSKRLIRSLAGVLSRSDGE